MANLCEKPTAVYQDIMKSPQASMEYNKAEHEIREIATELRHYGVDVDSRLQMRQVFETCCKVGNYTDSELKEQLRLECIFFPEGYMDGERHQEIVSKVRRTLKDAEKESVAAREKLKKAEESETPFEMMDRRPEALADINEFAGHCWH